MDDNDEKIRVVTLLTEEEKEDLQILSWRSGRSVSGYIRYLVNEDIERNSDEISETRRRWLKKTNP